MTTEIQRDLLPDGYSDLSVIDKDLLAIYGVIKNKFPDVWVNLNGKQRVHNYCGWRPQDCKVGAAKSAHKQGKALDFHCKNLNELREWIAANNDTLGITRMECSSATPTWCHIDIMPLTEAQKSKVCKNGIYVFNP
jgi:hypothetical protein